jgi:hypothetical protein
VCVFVMIHCKLLALRHQNLQVQMVTMKWFANTTIFLFPCTLFLYNKIITSSNTCTAQRSCYITQSSREFSTYSAFTSPWVLKLLRHFEFAIAVLW